MPEIDITDKIGYTLLKKGIIDFETLEKSLKMKDSDENKKNRKNLGQILVTEFGADHDSVFREVANLYAFREIYVADEKIDEARIAFVKKLVEALTDQQREMMVQAKMLPFKYDERQADKLVIIAADPTDRNLPVVARSFNVKKYEICYVRLKDLQTLMEKIVPAQNEFLKLLQQEEEVKIGDGTGDESVDEQALEAEISKSALVNLFEGCIVEAVRRGVSDIHIVAAEGNKTNFMFRVDGNLQVWHCQENTMPEAVMAVVKDRTKNVDRFEREMSQDGFIQRVVDGHQLRFRVSIMPIVTTEFKNKFESIVIRVLDDRKVITDLEKLGLQGPARGFFYKAIGKPQGIIILTGPTGSGKSTTLIAALYQVIDPTVNVLTIEEPVEYIIKGARQLKIGPKMGFEQSIRGILRHDPDIVLVGEMRDKITAETAIKLANTGHLVFSTLHTNDAPSAVARLYKMGIEPFLIAYAINIIVAQRLIRTLCKICKEPVDTSEMDDLLKFGFSEEDLKAHTIYRAVGCDKCNGGYKGRAAIHEALFFTKQIKTIILNAGEKVDEDAIRDQAAKDGMWTLRRSGMERMKEGSTSLEEVISSTVEDD
ncbi:MAG TPA: pilus assembly protein PilB [Bacteroidetes bacterium]|nr:MAG: pilus assembly protein PilB [Ignavibacteria bacterium GWA2_54_16]HCA82105.1 pilus assembly protein PilB [Bacteroidota bacterium]